MLQLLRHKHVAKIIFWGLLILILPAFVLWGTGNIGGPKKKGPAYAGMIDNRKVSFDDLASGIVNTRIQLILNYFNRPDILNALFSNKPLMAKLAWDRLIMLSEVKKLGIKVPDNEVISFIRSHPLFNRNGAFDDKLYAYILQYNMGVNARSFEETVRQNISIGKLNDMLTKDVMVSDADIAAEYMKDNSKYKISYIFFDLKDKLGSVDISDETVKDYYEKHKGEIAVKPKPGEPAGAPKLATFEEARPDIKTFLAETEARKLAFDDAAAMGQKIFDMMDKEKLSFEDTATKLGLKPAQTDFILRTEKIEVAGESPILPQALLTVKPGEVSKPIPAQNGILIIKVSEISKLDEEKLKAAKDEYASKALMAKKNEYLDGWLRGLETKTTVNIDLNDYEKYFK